MARDIRCVVTKLDDEGRSVWGSDAVVTTVKESGTRSNNVWRIPSCPPDVRDDHTPTTTENWPDPTGLVFRVAEMPPKTRVEAGQEDSWHPHWHASSTVDLMTVISGEVWAYQSHEDEGIVLKPGDTFIQRGTMHAWENKGDVPCLFSVVLVDATNKGAPVRQVGE